jgi:alpha-D-ribose 1-methylphosphonate 5-triphosphate synthase subunit PhnH
MKQADLERIRPGFADPTLGSQAVFRLALQALSMPGRPTDVPMLAQCPNEGQASAALLMLTLLDSDCTVWLSESLARSDTYAWLRFHTGCRVVNEPSEARFLWLGKGDLWPRLSDMDGGSDEYPDQSATCVMEVTAMGGECSQNFTLSGPGVAGELSLSVAGLPAGFEDQWSDNHQSFPRGVDVFLCSGPQVVGLPRSVCLRAAVEA